MINIKILIFFPVYLQYTESVKVTAARKVSISEIDLWTSKSCNMFKLCRFESIKHVLSFVFVIL